MRNSAQTRKSTNIQSSLLEMQHAFAEWVKQLPFIKSEIPRKPERGNQDEKSADQASAPHPTNDALAGQSPGNQP